MIDRPKIPKFSNESEEADWWYANREWVEREFEQAAREGRLKSGSTVLERIHTAKNSNSLTVPLSPDDLSRLRSLAAHKDRTKQLTPERCFMKRYSRRSAVADVSI